MKLTFALAMALAMAAATSAAQAAILTVNFTVAPGTWFGGGTPYGLIDPSLSGSVDVDTTDTSGNSFSALNFVTGTKTWTLADINIGSSYVQFDGFGNFGQFALILTSGNYVYTNNTVALFDGDSNLACNGCVSTSIGTGTVPEPASWAMLIAGFGMTGALLRRRRGLAVA